MKKIKIAQIIPSFGVGGAEKLVLDYITYFDKDSVEIIAISLYGNKKTIHDKFIENHGLKVIYLNKKPGLDFRMFRKIDQIIREFKPDVIHSHMYTIKYLFYSILKNRNISLFHTIHSEPKKDVNRIDKFFNKIAFTKLKCTPIALTDKLANSINEFYGINNSIVLNNGIDLDTFRNENCNKYNIREEYNISSDSFLIGHVGRFSVEKNHDFLIDVFYEYKNLNSKAVLFLVGEGKLKENIKNKVERLKIEDSVIFLGLRNDVARILSSLDLFLFPSIYEGFPVTLIEAQSIKPALKCIISDSIDPSCVLNKNTHTMSLSESPSTWANAISNIKLYDEGANDKINEFDIKYIVKKLETLYREKLESKNN